MQLNGKKETGFESKLSLTDFVKGVIMVVISVPSIKKKRFE